MPSEIFFGNRWVDVRDPDVVVLVHFLFDAIDRAPQTEWYAQARTTWEKRISSSGYGLMNLDLDKLVTNADEKERMLGLLEAATESIRSRGEFISREWLNSLQPREAIYSRDMRSEYYLALIEKIASMIRETELEDPPMIGL